MSIFEEKNDLTVNKTSEIFKYYLRLIFKDVKDEIKDYQEKLEEKEIEDKKNKLEEYYQKEPVINKEDFEYAVRLFITLVLFREEDKENKIKCNRKNIVNYLEAPDLWDKNKYKDIKFKENLNELKIINIQINQILYIVDIKEEDTSDVQEHIESKEKKTEQIVSNDPGKESDDENESETEEENQEDSDDERGGGRD